MRSYLIIKLLLSYTSYSTRETVRSNFIIINLIGAEDISISTTINEIKSINSSRAIFYKAFTEYTEGSKVLIPNTPVGIYLLTLEYLLRRRQLTKLLNEYFIRDVKVIYLGNVSPLIYNKAAINQTLTFIDIVSSLTLPIGR